MAEETKEKTNKGEHQRLNHFVDFIKNRFDLESDHAPQSEVVAAISRSVEFKGTNLWILIFAVLIASLGLNINLTAVIIGAMLISPLMGPTMGVGLALGINDFELMKRSLRNFGFMVLISIITSTIYFLISPISTAQSELLARTNPTVYDVFIAFFGGMAGIIAQSRKDRSISMVIPGVAIATTLLPPLCTAGFGIATGQIKFIWGALYLFFINTVFIALATYVMVRFLKYEKKVFLDKARERTVKNYMIVVAVVTLVPSVILAYNIVQRTIFESSAERYISTVFNYKNTMVLDQTLVHMDRSNDMRSRIELLLIGEALPEMVIENAQAQLDDFGLRNTDLVVRQSDGSESIDFSALQLNYAQLLDEKNRRISELEGNLSRFESDTLALADIAREAGAVFPEIETLSLSRQDEYNTDGEVTDTVLVCVFKPKDSRTKVDRDKLSRWLAVRTRSEKVRIYEE